MNITLDMLTVKQSTPPSGHPTIELAWGDSRDGPNDYPRSIIIYTNVNAAHFCQQLRGETKWYQSIAFGDGQLAVEPSASGWVVYSNPIPSESFVSFPGKALAVVIGNLKPDEKYTFSEAALNKLRREYRSRFRLAFANQETKAEFLTIARGERGKGFMRIVRGELHLAGSYCYDKHPAILKVYQDFRHGNFSFVCRIDEKPHFNGGWILHANGYSSHH